MSAGARSTLARLLGVRSWPLRAYFVLLLAAFIASAASAAVYLHAPSSDDSRATAAHDASFAAKAAAAQLGTLIATDKSAVDQLASNPQISKALASPKGCALTDDGLGGPDGSHLDIIRADGTVACSSRPAVKGTVGVYRAADWLRRALAAPFSVAPILDPRTGAFVAIYAAPIADGRGVVAGFADLSSVGGVLASLYNDGHPDEFLVTTANGRQVIARSIDPERWVGRSLRAGALPQAAGSFTQRDLEGTTRLYAEATVPGLGWRFYVGEDAAAAFAAGRQLETTELAIVGAGLLLVLLAAWFAYRNLAQPIQRLSSSLAAASVLGDNPLGPISGPAEVMSLAAAASALIASVGRELAACELAERRARAVLETTLDAVITIDHEGTIVEFNPAAERMFGRSKADVLGVEMASVFVPPAGREAHRHGLRKLVEDGDSTILGKRIELTGLRRGGTEFPIELTITQGPLEGEAFFTAHVRDISARVGAEQALQVSEERYRLLFEANPSPMWVLDAETLRFLAVNDATVGHYGYSREEMLAMTIEDILTAEELAKLRRDLTSRPVTGRGLSRAGIWRHRLKDDSLIDVEVTSQDHEFEGRAARVVLAQDVAQREQTEQALRRSEARFRDLFENATDLIATVDLDGCLTAVNAAFTRALGYTKEELIGTPIRDLVPPEWHHRLEQARNGKLNEQVGNTVYEHELEARDGQRIHVEVASRVIEENGRPVGVEAICRDLSDRQRADKLEAQLLQAQRLESVGRLAGGIAHDFNNLLTVISGYTEALLEQEDAASATELGEIAAAAARATALTRQLLAFSRRQVLQPQVIDLNQIVNGMMPMLTRLIGEDIELAAPLDAELDPVLADPGQVEQILLNLVVNARDAMPNGGRLTIETGNVDLDEDYLEQHPEASAGSHAMLAVTDTGTGMTPEVIAQVFEPFFTTKPVGAGTGLGLSTVYGITKQSGGGVWVYSEPGRGSSFKIYLPAVHAACAIERRSPKPESAQRGTETILLVEDEQAVRDLTARVLRKHGYTVIAAENPLSALRLIEQHPAIDLLLTDLVMPHMDGHQLAQQITDKTATARVLFMSGYADQSLNLHGGLDLAAFLEKPFNAVDLTRKIREVLDAPAEAPTTTAALLASPG